MTAERPESRTVCVKSNSI